MLKLLLTFMGIRTPELTKAVIWRLKTSSTRQKRRGERGSPCLTPLLHGKYPWVDPLKAIDILAYSSIAEIQWQKVQLKPYLFKTVRRKLQLMVSKALDMSTLIEKLPPRVLLSRRFATSEARHKKYYLPRSRRPWICPL